MRLRKRSGWVAVDCAQSLAMRPTFSPPSEVAEYRIVRLLGRGAMGQVYLAQDTLLDRPVAIKFIASEPSPALRERFLVEARAIARLHHPNVVSIYRVGEHAGRPYLVSEFVRGQSLSDLPKPVPLNEALRIGLGLSAGLRAAHQAGVLHRDVKPANAMLTDGGEAKLLDFGLAKLSPQQVPSAAEASSDASSPTAHAAAEQSISGDEATLTPEADAKRSGLALPSADVTLSGPATGDEPSVRDDVLPAQPPVSLTKTGAWVGTPRYMAPEIFSGEPATTRSDVYSLGALLFELCVGKPPFVESDVARLSSVVQSQDAPLLDSLIPDGALSAGISQIVARCLRRNPLERYQDGNELWQALTQLSSSPVSARVVPSSRRAWPWGLAMLSLLGLWLGRSYVTPSSQPLPTVGDAGRVAWTHVVDAGAELRMPDLREPVPQPDLRENPTDMLRPQAVQRPKAKPQTQAASPSPKPVPTVPAEPVRPMPVEKPAGIPASGHKPDSNDSVEIPIER